MISPSSSSPSQPSSPPPFPSYGPTVERVRDATARLLGTVAAMPDEQWSAPSVLPGWTRAHLVAHLALNAEALAAVSAALLRGATIPVYPSDAARDGDIEALAARSPGEQRERLSAAVVAWQAAASALGADGTRIAGRSVERTPGGATFPVAELPAMRWREVEIHHADLGLANGPADWPADFAGYVLRLLAWDRGADHDLVLRTPAGDLLVGAGTGPVISGSAAALAWWLLGRGTGDGLTMGGPAADGPAGELPALGPWVRRPPPPATTP